LAETKFKVSGKQSGTRHLHGKGLFEIGGSPNQTKSFKVGKGPPLTQLLVSAPRGAEYASRL